MNPKIYETLRDLEKDKFFGTVEIHYQGGTAHTIKVTKSIKLSSQGGVNHEKDKKE